MATLVQRINDLATRIATEIKSVRTLVNGNASSLVALNTTAKTSIVAAINELKAGLDAAQLAAGAQIDDAATASTVKTYSVTKIRDLVTTSISAITTGAPAALDTLAESSAALGNDANFAATITTALGNRVRIDTAAQGLTAAQKTNAQTNIDVYGTAAIGNPDTDFATLFVSGLV